jgi:uncharacterized repeat protein (TIGR01451 family)
MADRVRFHSFSLLTALTLGLGLCLTVLTCLAFIAGPISLAQAAGTIRYVAPTGINSNNLCANSAKPCKTIQRAVDVAAPGDEIRVAAGTYTGVTFREGYTSVVYITKSLTLRGGFTLANWDISNPTNNFTTLNGQGLGGVIGISGTLGVTIEGLRLTGGTGARNPGCGICVATATVTLRDNTIFGNRSGMLIGFGSVATVSHNLIYSNTLDGVEFFFLSGQAILADNTISGNKWSGITLLGSSGVTLERNLIENNLTVENCDPLITTSCNGGGVSLYVSNATLSQNVIRQNEAGLDGGGVSLAQSTATLRANTLLNNTAGRGGGGVSLHYSTARLEHNRIISNTAGQGGGGVTDDGNSQIILSGNLIAGNTARSGGGLVLGASAHPITLEGDIIRHNVSQELGGGIFFTGGQLTLTNTIIADNRAGVAGSGLYLSYPLARLFHTTIAHNSGGDGSGIHIAFTQPGFNTVALTNTILVSQTIGITASAGSTATLNSVLWFGNGSNTGGAGTINVTNQTTGNPAFAADGYHLTPASAALDKGVNAGVGTDIDGQPRPFGPAPDLGADEGQPALLVTKETNLPFALPGRPLTYTLYVTNTGFVDLHATISDTLPPEVTPTGLRTWTAIIPAFGGVWTERIAVTVASDFSGTLTNVVEASSVEGAKGEYTQSVGVGRVYYLPVIRKGK